MKNIVFGLICMVILGLTLRGIPGNPEKSSFNSPLWMEDGPFELSPERGRYALTYSLVEDKSFSFDLPVARFTIPDLGYIDGKYVSLFAPGISILIIPGYLAGKILGISQVGTYAVISFFAVLNVLLIDTIARKLGASKIYSALAALTFLFATPAFAYAVSLYQHHVSVFLLLAGIYSYLNINKKYSAWIIWFLAAASVTVDYPNFFMMMPLMVLAVLKTFGVEETKEAFRIKFRFSYLFSILAITFPLTFLGWFNYQSYGDSLRLAGTVMNVRSIDSQELSGELSLEEDNEGSSIEERVGSNTIALAFFNTRNISNGLYIHLFSPDRGMIVYAPILIFSVVGGFYLYRKNPQVLALFTGIALINLFVYSMWGDPWGGWAFGSRYMIPFYAVASILLALGMENFLKKKIIKTAFLLILIYSVFVNTLGAVTTSLNPPKVEVLQLEELSGKEEKYTFERNWDYLKSFGSKSYFYGKYISDLLNPVDFYFLLASTLSFFLISLMFYDLYARKLPFGFTAVSEMKSKTVASVLTDDSKFIPVKFGIPRFWKNINILRKGRLSIWKDQ